VTLFNSSTVNAAATDSATSWLRLAVAVLVSTIGGVGMWSVIVVLPTIQAEFGVDRAAAARQLQHHIKSVVGVSARVEVCDPGALPRSEGKAKRVVDKRAKG